MLLLGVEKDPILALASFGQLLKKILLQESLFEKQMDFRTMIVTKVVVRIEIKAIVILIRY
jgi:hypothetical protein